MKRLYRMLKRAPLIFLLLLFLNIGINDVDKVYASNNLLLGVHILSPHDLEYAAKLLKTQETKDQWHLLTIPLSLDDINHVAEWQKFFDECKQQRFIPVIRLATVVEDGVWQRPTRKNIVDQFQFLQLLSWPTEDRYVIIFNEVNHAKEWGGVVDPISYTQILEFASSWAHTEPLQYKILPAAMDLAAPNSKETTNAFEYLLMMLEQNPWIFDHIDVWNSHSYPNPAFSASPQKKGLNSLRGFEEELNYLKRKTGRDLEVMITETGWVDNRYTRPWLGSYYLYALQHIWTHPKVIGVTPFLLRGSPGPFASFSFFDADGKPTIHYDAYREGIKGVTIDSEI